MKKWDKLFIFIDKTSNIYQIKKHKYNKLTTDAIISTYKKISDEITNKCRLADGKKVIENKEVVHQLFVKVGTVVNHFKRSESILLNKPKVR